MHPIERLRYVARASGGDQGIIVRETAGALASFGGDPNGLVTACRRIVARQPISGPLVWLCARMLTGGDPMGEAWRAVDEVEGDRTPHELAHHLPDDATVVVLGWPEQAAVALGRRGDLEVLVADTDHEAGSLVQRLVRNGGDATEIPLRGLSASVADADLVVVEATAMGPDAFLATSGSRAAAAVARHAEIPVWLVAGVGRMLPARMWTSLLERVDAVGDDPWETEVEPVPLDLVDRVVGPLGLEDPAAALRRTDCPVAPELCRSDLVL